MAPPRPTVRPTVRAGLVAGLAAAALAFAPFQAAQAQGGQAAAPAPVDDPASLVDPIVGTSGAVDTFPGADVPSGMLQWSPDTSPDRPAGGGYEYNDKKILGYSLSHISGPGCGAGGDVPILPYTGALSGDLGSVTTGFSHDHESAKAGAYSLTTDDGVSTSLGAATRGGVGTFTFPDSATPRLLLKLSGGATKVDGTRAQVVGDNEVTGSVDSGHFCGAKNTYTLHFDIKFDKPFTEHGTWTGSTITPNTRSLKAASPKQQPAEPQGKSTPPFAPAPTLHGSGVTPKASKDAPVTGANGVYLGFGDNHKVSARVGISYTSDDEAAKNLKADAPDFDLARVQQRAHGAWNAVLKKIAIGGGSHDRQVEFYTALYHALLHPNVFSDADGSYAGMDHQTHRLKPGQHAQYATYSGWDTYRSQAQLMAMLEPDVASDVVTSMLNGYDESGSLPKWAQNNGESYVMVGDPADGIIAGSYAFGARGFDTKRALKAMSDQATHANADRPGQSVRDAKGYLPLDGSNWGCCNFYGPVSTQEEYDSADYAIASFAKSLGDSGTYTKFASRAQDWENVFNPQSGYLQGRLSDGRFAPGFTPGSSNGFVEGTSAQYTPMVPFNISGLVRARGGKAAYSTFLDSLFTSIDHPSSTNADLSNEPSIEIPYEYDWTGEPWKAQSTVRQAQDKLWFNKPVGSFGNDDLGAMSSWYVWSALGMYPEVPGTDTMALGSPLFPTAKVSTAPGKTLSISAPKAADDAPYVQSMTVNGKNWNQPWLSFGDLARGGSITADLGTAPNKAWGSSASAEPPSDTTGEQPVLASTGPTDGGGLVIAPGGKGTATIDLANISDKPVTVDWSAKAPDGVTLDRSSGSVTVGAHAKAEEKVVLTGGDTEGSYSVPVSLTAGGKALPGTALAAAVAKPGEMWPYRTNTGTAADGSTFSGGFDGGGWSYSTNALDAAGVKTGGTVTSDGITYDWPGGTGKPDNIETAGQRIPVSAPAGASAVGFLGSASNAPSAGSKATVTLTYTDGSTSTGSLVFSDWTLNGGGGKPAAGDATAAATGYRNTGSGGKDTIKTYLFSTQVKADAGKTIASITLPAADDGALHVFSIGYAK